MAFNLETVASGASPTNDSLLIPYSNLDGIADATELGNSQAEDDAKVSSAILSAMDVAIRSLSNPLGVASARPNPIGTGTNLFNQNINITWNYVANTVDKSATVYPAVGGSSKTVAFTDIFPNAEVLTTTGTATADSIALPMADLQNYSADATVANKQGALADDQRDMLEGLTRYMFDAVDTRSGTVSSGITAKTLGGVTGITPNSQFYTDTTFSESDVNNILLFSRNYSVTHQYQLDPDTGTYELNVTTS